MIGGPSCAVPAERLSVTDAGDEGERRKVRLLVLAHQAVETGKSPASRAALILKGANGVNP